MSADIALRGYAICTEPRSGSSYLCQLLASTGLLGRPMEYFNQRHMRGFGFSDFPADPEAQLAAIPRLAATSNGVYGLKLFSINFDQALQTRWAARLPGLVFVHLKRLDVLGQAISHVRAMQTDQWSDGDRPKAEAAFDFGQINNELVRIVRAQARWAYYFGRNGLPVLHLAYEQVIADPQSAVDAIARLVGLTQATPVDPALVRNVQLSDGLSRTWREAFLARARDPTVFDQ